MFFSLLLRGRVRPSLFFLFIPYSTFTRVKEIFPLFFLFGFEDGICLNVYVNCNLNGPDYLCAVMVGLRFIFRPFILYLAVKVSDFRVFNIQYKCGGAQMNHGLFFHILYNLYDVYMAILFRGAGVEVRGV